MDARRDESPQHNPIAFAKVGTQLLGQYCLPLIAFLYAHPTCESFLAGAALSIKKGDLPGPYHPPHIRRDYCNPGRYIDVAAYQMNVAPTPAKTEEAPLQADFETLWNESRRKR